MCFRNVSKLWLTDNNYNEALEVQTRLYDEIESYVRSILPLGRDIQNYDHMLSHIHCMESVSIKSFSGPYFPTFGLSIWVSLRKQSECREIWNRKTNRDIKTLALQCIVLEKLPAGIK